MANDQHIEWLKEGAEKWNARRESDHFTPDLEDTDFSREFREFRNYGQGRMVHLAGINLANSNLKGANLSYVDFTNADLQNAKLANATIERVNFTNANLTNADFTDVAEARRAIFTNANLANANLISTRLGSVDLAGTQPWKARLYTDEERNWSPKPYECELKAIGNIRDLLERIQRLQVHHKDAHHKDAGTRLYFRGESQCGTTDCPWVLQPSVMRPQYGLRQYEGEMLSDLISRRPEEFSDRGSALAEWVLAQHHGLPTRFLDITRNPLVAMFNACRDDEKEVGQLHIFVVPRVLIKPFNDNTIIKIARLAKLARNEQKLIVGSEEKVPVPVDDNPIGYPTGRGINSQRFDIKDLYKVFVIEPQQSPERIRAQSGAFLASAFHERFEPEEIRRHNESIPVYAHYKLEIPSDYKRKILGQLRLLNMTEETLFPGPDSSAAAVRAMYNSQ